MRRKHFLIAMLMVLVLIFTSACKGTKVDKNESSSVSGSYDSSDNSDSNDSDDIYNESDEDNASGSEDDSDASGNSGNSGNSGGSGSKGNSGSTGNSGGSSNSSADTNIPTLPEIAETITTPTYTGPNYVVDVDLNTTVNAQWDGIGGNVVAMNMISGYNQGYTDAFWDADVSRIMKMRPGLVRFWMQVDWFELVKDQPDFDTPQMKAVYRYFDAFKKAGVDVQITISWKVGEAIQDWFAIPSTSAWGNSTTYESAPRDLDHFARCCYRLIKELHDRGYTNVKYLTYNNEPHLEDFECYGDQIWYYLQMSQKVSDYFKAKGYRDKIKLWGGEAEVGPWTDALSQRPDLYDGISWHNYGITADTMLAELLKIPSNSAGIKQQWYISEYGSGEIGWDKGIGGAALAGANYGLSGILEWCLIGVGSMSPDPNGSGWDMNSNMDFWNSFNLSVEKRFGVTDANGNVTTSKIENGQVNKPYYVAALLNNYITHEDSKVVKSTVNTQGMRSATFVDKKTGDITVVAEFNANTQNRNLTVNFGKAINKTFYKYVYNDNIKCDQNALVPAMSKSFKNVGKQLKDSDVEKEYSIVVYSTKKPKTQIDLGENAYVELKAGQSVTIDASIIDGAADSEIVWEISNANNHAEDISRTGKLVVNGKSATYTAAADAIGADDALTKSTYNVRIQHQDVISVKASLKNNPDVYSISIIRIVV